MLRALLIDDETGARADLRQLLEPHAADVATCGEAGTLDEIEAALAQPNYDVVFLDVQLRGATAFDLVPRIRPEARIVFVTAHDRYAVRAFDVNALDYLLKPLSPERLAETIARVVAAFARAQRVAADVSRPGGEPEPDEPPPPRLAPDDIVYLRTGTQGRFVPLPQISLIDAEQNYSAACMTDGTRLLVRRTLKSWEDVLPPTHFMRVHRTAIVNLERITRYERDREERTLLFLQGVPTPIPATRKLWSDLQEKLTRLHRTL